MKTVVAPWWLVLCCCCAWILPQHAVWAATRDHDCKSACSVQEMVYFPDNCCCLPCSSSGSFLELPEGVSEDDMSQVPRYSMCCENNSSSRRVSVFTFVLMWSFLIHSYVLAGYWLRGYALTPTNITELGRSPGYGNGDHKSNNNSSNSDDVDCGPKATLSGRAVRYVFLHRSSGSAGDDHQEPSSYGATVELFHRQDAASEEQETVEVSLNSHEAYQKLEDYCRARDGVWWETTTKDDAHPTNGYRLLVVRTTTTGDGGDAAADLGAAAAASRLFLYRPYHYDGKWKFEAMAYPFCSAVYLWDFLQEQRLYWWSWILPAVLINAVAALLANFYFVTFGYQGKRRPYWPWTKEEQPNDADTNTEGSASSSSPALRDPLFRA